tara:strand:- start:176 stop:622 length:447 start_codon:yes stop_codon:yes gene_type:complete
MSDRKVIFEMNVSALKELVGKLPETDYQLIVQFTASWCKPCKSIKDLCMSLAERLPSKVLYALIDIDENLDLYLFMKGKKMLSGVPCIMRWDQSERSGMDWFVADQIVTGADEEMVKDLFANSDSRGTTESESKKLAVSMDGLSSATV